MSECPKCGSTITLWQMRMHTWWTPVICVNCKEKLNFNKKDWLKIKIPLLVVFFFAAILYLVKPLFIKNLLIYSALQVLVGALIIFIAILTLIRLKSVKLVSKIE